MVIVLVTVLVVIQFIPRNRNASLSQSPERITKVYPVSLGVEAIFKKSCYDCHSNHTNYPWYAKVQPLRYMLDNHIKGGKSELNFDEFDAYTARKKRSRLRAIGESLDEGSMPLASYTLIHRDAILTEKDKETLKNWVKMAQNMQQ